MDRYQILQSLGRGGFGETFLAVDTHLPSQRKCVIKQLKPAVESPTIPEWLKERFQKEASILESLGQHHPQIPQLYAYFSENNNFYLVQEWIDGLTLSQLHYQKGNLSPSQVQSIIEQLLQVLAYIHSRKIIHRDIKPDNIMIRGRDQLPMLIDFGIMKEAIATYVDPNGKTPYSVPLGTPGYMASEQAAGRPVYSSDLYSLGLTAIFLLTGKSPQNLDYDSQSGEIIWRNLLPNLSNPLANVIDRAIRFHPRDRFSSAEEMLVALSQSRHSGVTVATQVVSPETRKLTNVSAWDKKSDPLVLPAWFQWFIFPISLASVVLGGFILGFNLLANRQSSSPPPQPVESVSPEFPATPFSPTPFTPDPSPTLTPEVTLTPSPTVPPTPKPQLTPLLPEPIIPPGAELTPLTPIPPRPRPQNPPNTPLPPLFPASPTPQAQEQAIPIPVEEFKENSRIW